MSKTATKTKSNESPESIGAKLARLDASVEWFYGEDFNLDQALDHYSAAAKLAQEIEQDLAELKNEVSVIADFTKS